MRKLVWVIGAAVVVLGGVVPGAVGGGAQPAPGECASVSRQAELARYEPLPCAAEEANVKVAKVVAETEPCPRGGSPYTTYTSSARVCLIPNFVEGVCYRHDRQSGMRRVDCATTESLKVRKVARGAAECGDDRKVAYPEPPVTFCLVSHAPWLR
ncbi:LppU/SCO3897 family protein [Saccharothrix australiensis]|uniref:Uncharacterized protein n=1 Tax=Saccharothrix australiensis TaxID=2072 RepID=A0A495VVA5_9PSEU|nr:hypothetical protein [Saccharothrix australiensis]RKT52295.1 hypothetical protein C8E97_0805 [Saccharothrix australiensis]